MSLVRTALCTAVACGSAAVAQTVNLGVDNSTATWLGYMNVTLLNGNFQFGSGWGIGDLVSSFDDAAPSVTMSPNTIGDPNEYWYQDPTGGGNQNPGGPGAPGNKIMEANLYQESTNAGLHGVTVVFSGFVVANSLTSEHEAKIFIRDFAPDYSSSVDSFISAPLSGAFSVSLATINDTARHVQWGFQLKGVNVWATDVAPFGSITYSSVPAPAAAAIAGFGGLIASRRRRA